MASLAQDGMELYKDVVVVGVLVVAGETHG